MMTVRGNPQRLFCAGVKWGDLERTRFEDIVGYFARRVEDCYFTPVHQLLLPSYQTTGFIILAVISSLIDLLSQYYYWAPTIKHKEKYKRFLREHFIEFRQPISLKKFPHVKDLADFFYEGFRCQILHNFMLSEHSTIGWKTGIVYIHVWDPSKDAKEIIINPRQLVERLEGFFRQYTRDLSDPAQEQLRSSFAKKFYFDTGVKIDGFSMRGPEKVCFENGVLAAKFL